MQDFTFIKRRCFFLLLILQLGLASCQQNTSFFFVKNKGAVMPVKIAGNRESDTFIIFLAGGPSGDGHIYRSIFPFFRKSMEPHFNLVYYDQRGGGNTQGTYDTTTLNLTQLSEDLDKIVKVLKLDYGASHVFLMGYSYGGALGMSYLLNTNYRKNIKGFISIEGAFDRAEQSNYQDQLLSYWLEEWVEEGLIDGYDALLEGYNCTQKNDPVACRKDSVRLLENIQELAAIAEKTNRFQLNPERIGGLLGFTFFSQSNPLFSSINENQNARYFHQEFDNLTLSDKISGILTPVLFICGRYDTNVPVFDAQKMYSSIGTKKENKELVVLKQSGHLPMMTEPEQLSTVILEFIQKVKK